MPVKGTELAVYVSAVPRECDLLRVDIWPVRKNEVKASAANKGTGGDKGKARLRVGLLEKRRHVLGVRAWIDHTDVAAGDAL